MVKLLPIQLSQKETLKLARLSRAALGQKLSLECYLLKKPLKICASTPPQILNYNFVLIFLGVLEG